ncbi:MAG: YbbR domain-containing protein [Sphingobacteriales bacterium]|jgi:YbbR domain-containing protein
MIITNELPNQLDVSVNSTGWQLMGLRGKQLTSSLKVDVTKYQKRRYVLTKDLILPGGKSSWRQLNITSISPDTIFLQMDNKFLKKVPIKLNGTFSFEQQFQFMESPIIEPDSVEIAGPEEVLSSINFWETEMVNFERLSENVQENITLKPSTNPGIQLFDTNIVLNLFVEHFTEGSIQIPIQIENEKSSQQLEIYPKTVEVSYRVGFSNYDKVNAKQFRAVIDASTEDKEKNTLKIKLVQKPDYLESLTLKPSEVNFVIRK